MVDPVFGVWLAIQRCILDVNILVRWVKVDVSDGGRLLCKWMLDLCTLKIWRYDQVHILSRIGE